MSLHSVKPLLELPESEGFLFRQGAYQIALFRVGNSVRAIDNVCPHAGADLASGEFDGDSVACPWHGWEFDTRSGQCSSVEGFEVETYRVVIEEGVVKVELD